MTNRREFLKQTAYAGLIGLGTAAIPASIVDTPSAPRENAAVPLSKTQNDPNKSGLEFIDTSFENASPLWYEFAPDGSIGVNLLYDHERSSPNRAAGHFHFLLQAEVGSRLTLEFKNLDNIWNGQPSSIAKELKTAVISPDGRDWKTVALESAADNRVRLTVDMPGPRLYVARVEPYRLSDLDRLLAVIRDNPQVKIESIGKTVEGRELEIVRIGNQRARYRVFLRARAHPWEAGSSWVVQGLVQRLLLPDALSKQYLDRYCVYILLMANKDGVAHGYTRFNLLGKDLNRDWDKAADPQLAPENCALEKWLEGMIQAGQPPHLALELHNDASGQLHISRPPVPRLEEHLRRMATFEQLLRQQTWFTEGSTGETFRNSGTLADGWLERYDIDSVVHELNCNWIEGLKDYPSARHWEDYGAKLAGVFYEYFDSDSHSYFPPPESQGGWRALEKAEDLRRLGGMSPEKLAELKQWLLASDDRDFAAVVIRYGYIALQVERGNSAKTDSRRVASVSKAICATVLAIASEQSQRGLTPRKMRFDDPAFEFIPWAQPLSDPRKARITVRQLLNHTSGLCPEAAGAPNDGTWDYILGHSGDSRTARLAFDPGTGCGYSTHALAHAALVCESVTGKPYDEFAIEALFRPLGIEHWWFQYYEGGEKYGRHPSHGLGMPARDLARIAYCMLKEGRWQDKQVIPEWFVRETAAPTHSVKTLEMRWKLNPQIFSHGWELPAHLTGEDGRSGAGIPADARDKPGSGGQLIAFVPSLDLVITRQTGSSGDWQFEEYLRRACAAAIAEVK
jgi:CubicO group peptidase (beta-lactamase class C family)